MSFKRLEESLVKTTSKTFCNRTVQYKMNPENITLSLNVIFDNAVIDEQGVTSTHPSITVDLSLVPRTLSVFDVITIDSITYKILDIRLDSLGGALVLLQR